MKILIYDWALHFIGGGQKYACDIAAVLQGPHEVTLLCSKPTEKSVLEAAYGLDLSGVTLSSIKHRPFVEALPSGLYSVLLRQWNMTREAAEISAMTAEYDLFINCEASRSVIEPLSKQSVLVCHFPPRTELLREWESYGFFLKYTYALPYRLLVKSVQARNFAGLYGVVITSSRFAQDWIKKIWGIRAEVIYPSVPAGGCGARENIILTASRITPKKKMLEMLEAFRTLLGKGLGGWTFVIAGSAGPGGYGYLDEVRRRSRGLPVRIELNPGYELLRELYASAKIYWHMAGLGVDASSDPYEMEHFGITPVEAMAGGAVPVLYNGGGMREIVQDGISGYLVSGTEELAARTLELCGSPAKLGRMSENAIARSSLFSKEAFGTGIESLVAGSEARTRSAVS